MRSRPVTGASWTACEPQAVRTLEGVGSGRLDYSTESQRGGAHDRSASVCRGHHDLAASLFPWHFAAEIGHTPRGLGSASALIVAVSVVVLLSRRHGSRLRGGRHRRGHGRAGWLKDGRDVLELRVTDAATRKEY